MVFFKSFQCRRGFYPLLAENYSMQLSCLQKNVAKFNNGAPYEKLANFCSGVEEEHSLLLAHLKIHSSSQYLTPFLAGDCPNWRR